MDRNLKNFLDIDDEKIIFEPIRHWLIYTPLYLLILISIIIYYLGYMNNTNFLMITIILTVLAFVIKFVKNIDLVITNHRVIFKKGILKPRIYEYTHSEIDYFELKQSFVQKLFNSATLIVKSNNGLLFPIKNIIFPTNLKNKMVKNEY